MVSHKKIPFSTRTIRVGLTGGFGTGKSTVARMFAALGAEVVDADVLARLELKRGSEGYRRVVGSFGSKILDRAGRIRRRTLAREVFGHPGKIARLNRIVHPPVIRKLSERMRRSRAPVVVAVVPLLFEAGMEGSFDRVVVVKASPKRVAARVVPRRRMSAGEIEKRRRSQLPLAEKLGRADFIIDNDDSRARTGKQVAAIWYHRGHGCNSYRFVLQFVDKQGKFFFEGSVEGVYDPHPETERETLVNLLELVKINKHLEQVASSYEIGHSYGEGSVKYSLKSGVEKTIKLGRKVNLSDVAEDSKREDTDEKQTRRHE